MPCTRPQSSCATSGLVPPLCRGGRSTRSLPYKARRCRSHGRTTASGSGGGAGVLGFEPSNVDLSTNFAKGIVSRNRSRRILCETPMFRGLARTVAPPQSTELWRKRPAENNLSLAQLHLPCRAKRGKRRVPRAFAPASAAPESDLGYVLAERVGFEPTIRFPVYTLSKRAPSATRPPLRARRAQYNDGPRRDNPRGWGPIPRPQPTQRQRWNFLRLSPLISSP
jgi:hypothetical protein